MQEVVDAALLEKVKTSIERNKSLQMLCIVSVHDGVVDAVLKGAHGNTSLKQLTIQHPFDSRAVELQQIRPQLEFIELELELAVDY